MSDSLSNETRPDDASLFLGEDLTQALTRGFVNEWRGVRKKHAIFAALVSRSQA